MSQSIRVRAAALIERMRAGIGRRAAGIFLALLVEGLLTLALLTLAPPISQHKETEMTVFSFDAESPPEEVAAPPEPSAGAPQPAKRSEEKPPEPVEAPPQPVTPPPPLIELSRSQFAATDIAALPAPASPAVTARKPMAGPPNMGTSGDTPRVEGAGPNGEPLYAASWYRKPYDDELRGYLSTASGPGWALIACRTVADFRVEDCVAVDEWPERSNMARAVLAAAWQFRVRPPVFRGQPRVGEWVRIRIDYELRRQ